MPKPQLGMKRLKCSKKLAYDRAHIDDICAKIAAGQREYEEELVTAMSPRILSFVTKSVKRLVYLNDRLDDLYQAACVSVIKYARKFTPGTGVYAAYFLEKCFRLDLRGEMKQFMCRNGAKPDEGANNDMNDPCFRDYRPFDTPGAERSNVNTIEASAKRKTFDERYHLARLRLFKRLGTLRKLERDIVCEAQGIVPFRATRSPRLKKLAAEFKALPLATIAKKRALPVEHVMAVYTKALAKMS